MSCQNYGRSATIFFFNNRRQDHVLFAGKQIILQLVNCVFPLFHVRWRTFFSPFILFTPHCLFCFSRFSSAGSHSKYACYMMKSLSNYTIDDWFCLYVFFSEFCIYLCSLNAQSLIGDCWLQFIRFWLVCNYRTGCWQRRCLGKR